MNKVRKPECKHCKKECKTNRQIYCSAACYTNSGHRAAIGRDNGKSTYNKYWEKYAAAFHRKYGHLSYTEQVRRLIKIGQMRAYSSRFRQKHADQSMQ